MTIHTYIAEGIYEHLKSSAPGIAYNAIGAASRIRAIAKKRLPTVPRP
jgi:hypothetical protein